jgi:hypothetical protein
MAGEAGKADWFDVYQRVVWCVSRRTNHVTVATFRVRLNHVHGLGCCLHSCALVLRETARSGLRVRIVILMTGYESRRTSTFVPWN